ncbi:BRCA1 protein, partial [Chloroceryle aenea]|nr:BRCA1 protein [Chloroceryle aenea]
MDLAVVAIGDVQDVLLSMQKNLECPICLDVVKEPVSTKCDHIFCRFCMFKLLSAKKKDVIQCPLCKTEVTKRSLKEDFRFKQLTEGLLEAIKAFELDTGVKFLNSHHFPKTSPEATAAEFPCKESSVIQSKGFRNRKKCTEENGQENSTLEANVDTQLTNTRVKRHPLRNKPQKGDSEKGIYIEIGSDSSEELFKQTSNSRLEHRGTLQISSREEQEEPKSAEKGNDHSCKTQLGNLAAKGEILPNVPGESDCLKEVLSKKSTWSITEDAKAGQVNMTEYQRSPLNVLGVDLLTEQHDRLGNASPLRNGDASFFQNTEEMDTEQTQCNSKSKELDLEDNSESRLDKPKEIDVVESAEAVEMCQAENDSSPEKELPLEKPPQPETAHCATLNQVSKKRLKRSIQKVNEWFSKSNEILSSSSSQDDSAGATDVSGEGDMCLSDKDSCISEKTNPVVDSMETTVAEGNKRWSKQTADSIKDKIFGKTYKRERKSNLPIISRGILPTTKEDVAADNYLDNSSRKRLKRKRKSVLRPEDFIKRKDLEEADGPPQNINLCLGAAEKKRWDESSVVNENHPSENRENNTLKNRENNTLTAPEEGGGSRGEKPPEKVTGRECDGKLELDNSDQKSTKSCAAKRCKRSTRTMGALQLVDRNSVSPGPAEPQIDSYPSSEEPQKADSQQRQVRRSRRLQLLSEEMTKETGKGAVIKGAKPYDSAQEEPFSGVQRDVLVHTSECKDLCEPQGNKLPANLKDGELEASEIQSSLKNPPDTAETAKSLFNPTPFCQHSDGGSFVAASQEGENLLGRPFHPASPSVTLVQTASPLTEEMTEAPAASPQDSARDAQNVPGDFRTDVLPTDKKASDLTKEAEDSELDTQDLRNIFRHSKRLSFSLYPAPKKACAVEDAASEPLKVSGADQVANKHSKYLKAENLQEEKTAKNPSRVCEGEKLKTCEPACVSPVTCSVSSTEGIHTGEHQEDVSRAADQERLTPRKMGTARPKTRLHREQGNAKAASADVGIERELRQNPVKSDGSQRDGSNREEPIFKTRDLNTAGERCFSSESNPAGKAKAADSKGPTLPLQCRSMICPAACEHRPDESRCQVTDLKKSSKRERKQVKGDEEPATPAASTGMPECLVTKALEEPLQGSRDSAGLSETPDVLLCSDDGGSEENTNDSDRRDRSAVFVKRSDHALGKELPNRNLSSKPRPRGIQRPRRRAQKLQSSDEESSEDEDLPCFQALISGKSESTPLQVSKQVTSVAEASVSPITRPHSGSQDDSNVQGMPEVAVGKGCVSPSQDSECSVNLFSSQSNMSEESVDGAQELKKPLIQVHSSKQVSSVNENKETSQSWSGGLKRSRTDFREDCQEEPNTGANQGEASGYESETSYVEDSCGLFSQGEILTTQQKNIMQNNLKKLQQEMAVLEAALKQHGSQDCESSQRELPPFSSEGTLGMEQRRQERENTDEQKSGTRLNSTSVLSNLSGNVTRSPKNSSSSVRLLNPRTAEAPNSSVRTQNADQSSAPECKSKRSVGKKTAGKENTASPAVTSRKEMSIVASGLNQSEHLVVQKFARKTQSTLSNHITEGTTHVIMKTDQELVCERTLKYFLGIAGRKWVVSYQWVIQSFKEGRILDEENFEVRGDVINGRNHQGPRRARECLTEKIFKDFEICCYGPFTDMTTEHLEWMVELCGASVVKQLHLFTHTTNSAVVVVQPDAWMENMDCRAIQQKNNVAMVTREWVLDSVACYQCQELDAYLVS